MFILRDPAQAYHGGGTICKKGNPGFVAVFHRIHRSGRKCGDRMARWERQHINFTPEFITGFVKRSMKGRLRFACSRIGIDRTLSPESPFKYVRKKRRG